MMVHRLGVLEYSEALVRMQKVHESAISDGKNHLLLCSHPKIFTVGCNDKREWPIPVQRSDRGGSVTCHSEGQAIFYFCFQAARPAHFYRRVRNAFDSFFTEVLPAVAFDPKHPGWYLENRKIASVGFRYKGGVSLHGVALNCDVDLMFHNIVPPCGLEGVSATSLSAEGIPLGVEEVQNRLLVLIADSFDITIEER